MFTALQELVACGGLRHNVPMTAPVCLTVYTTTARLRVRMACAREDSNLRPVD